MRRHIPVSTAEWKPPAATNSTLCSEIADTCWGVPQHTSCVFAPNWPLELYPHVNTFPFVSHAIVWWSPHETCAILILFSAMTGLGTDKANCLDCSGDQPSCPSSLHPHVNSWPSVEIGTREQGPTGMKRGKKGHTSKRSSVSPSARHQRNRGMSRKALHNLRGAKVGCLLIFEGMP